MYLIELVTRDRVQFRFPAQPGQTLLEAAAQAGHYLPASCRAGACGACHATCETGSVEMDSCSEGALPAAQRAAGTVLLCRARARSDLRLKAPFGSETVGSQSVPERIATIAALEAAGSRAFRLVLQYEDDPRWGVGADFLPGQFMELSIPDTGTRRAYSVASTPNWEGRLEFLIRHQARGQFSGYLAGGARVGDRLGVRGPQGSFAADDLSQAPRWFVAGGTGLAPVLSMLGQMAEFGDRRACRLVFGVNQEDELFAKEQIAAACAALPQLALTLCLWKPGPAWAGFAGTPADALAGFPVDPAAPPDVYACGPPALIDAIATWTERAGICADRVFTERYLAAPI